MGVSVLRQSGLSGQEIDKAQWLRWWSGHKGQERHCLNQIDEYPAIYCTNIVDGAWWSRGRGSWEARRVWWRTTSSTEERMLSWSSCPRPASSSSTAHTGTITASTAAENNTSTLSSRDLCMAYFIHLWSHIFTNINKILKIYLVS